MRAAPRAVSISAATALVLAAVWFFWPLALGGQATYVSTHGISMEPGFHTGDLAILRSAGSYSVGDVVAYRSESLDTVVMHRIVEEDGDRFVIQGDNNHWLDEDRPTEDEILGRLSLRIPDGGAALGAVRSPAVIAAVAVAGLAVVGATRVPPRRTRGRSRHGAARRLPTPTFSMPTRALARQAALGAGAVALLAAVGTGVLFSLPSTQATSENLTVQQEGRFAYSGEAMAGTTYPTGAITTGDTVWTSLATAFTVSFTDTVSGPRLSDVRGSMRLDVSVSSPDGWSAYLDSGPVTELEDGTATASVPVDLPAASALLARHHAEVGMPTTTAATLTVTPVAAAAGKAGGVSFTTGSPDALDFALDATTLRPAAGSDVESALASSTETQVTVDGVGARTFSFRTLSITIDTARLAAVVVLVLSLATLAAGAWIGRTGRGDVADRFLVRHAARILPVTRFTPGPNVIDVSDVEALTRVAERFDTLVLHHVTDDEDVFAVRDVDATYRFVLPGGRTAREKPPVPAAVPAPVPDDLTTPLPRVAPGGLRGSFA